ncbi:MAG: D-alanyl-D-alanine carboxypeptidase family protein, partial [Bosea sp. (in: a-proteobacteria)]
MARAIRAAVLSIGAAAAVLVATADPAEAARRKKRGGYSPPYAAMVIDAKSGRTLHAVNEDALRHPASITKVMTLYLMFEQIERGRFTMETPLRVSSEAARQSPSKLYLEAGETIAVRDAVMALITKSANDAAVVVAENIAGDEDKFAEMMTRKARSLGMNRTVFRNASGLPDREQVTTARDLTILARAIQERFPKQYAMFSTRNFEYAGDVYRNHNKLLGRIEGVDGIKTGFTRSSGFNLMTSAKSDGKHVVAIVLGGRSGRARDAIMG